MSVRFFHIKSMIPQHRLNPLLVSQGLQDRTNSIWWRRTRPNWTGKQRSCTMRGSHWRWASTSSKADRREAWPRKTWPPWVSRLHIHRHAQDVIGAGTAGKDAFCVTFYKTSFIVANRLKSATQNHGTYLPSALDNLVFKMIFWVWILNLGLGSDKKSEMIFRFGLGKAHD